MYFLNVPDRAVYCYTFICYGIACYNYDGCFHLPMTYILGFVLAP